MGTDVRSSLSLFPLLHSNLLESTSLARPQDETSRLALYPKQECFPSMQRPGGLAEDGRFPHGGRSHQLRAKMDKPVHSFLPSQGTTGGGLLAPVVLCTS